MSTASIVRHVLTVTALALLAVTASARTLTLSVDALRNSSASARGVKVEVTEAPTSGAIALDVQHLDVAALGLSGALAWRCTLSAPVDDVRTCSGPVEITSGDGATQRADLAARVARDRIDFDLAREDARVGITLPLAAAATTSLRMKQVPVAWLRAPLAGAWPKGELRDGTIDAEVSLRADHAIEGRYATKNLTFNSVDGALSGASVDANGTFRIDDVSTAPRIRTNATLNTGDLRFGDVKITLPQAPVELALDAAASGEGAWIIHDLSWRDAGTLEFVARCVFSPSAPDPLRDLSVRVDRAVFPLALQRYATSLLAAQGLGNVSAKGALSGELALSPSGRPERIALAFEKLDLRDGDRIDVRGLDGAIDWSGEGERPPATIAWKSVNWDGIAIGPIKASLRSRNGAFELAKPLSTPLLGGMLGIQRASFDPRTGDRLHANAEFSVRKVGYDSADGTIAASGVALDGTIDLGGSIVAPEIRAQTTFHGGEFLYGPFYAKLPASPVRSKVTATLDGATWKIAQFDWDDPGVLEIGGSADVTPSEAKPFAALDAELRRVDLGPAVDRYAHSWLAAKGYAELAAKGGVSGRLKFDRDGLDRFAFVADDVDVRDGAGRFAFAGIDGGIDWRYGEEGAPTSLGWRSIELFRIPLGAANAKFRSEDAAIVLAEPIAIGVLGGEVRLEKLSLQPRLPRGDRYAGSFAIAGIDMAQLSAAFGWPRFGGSLSGGIPEIEFSGDTIELHGGLDLYVFDGYLGISGLTLERPFGIAPSLLANVHFENFDLERVTSAFSFGGMSGRLNGNIRDLRLVDWSPVAFDASLRADGGGRMSYKAVSDLTALGGGGGLTDSLQTMALKIFDTFGYRRLGIRCKLAAEICAMGGIESVAADAAETGSGADSYTIVEGSGLPRIQIIGHRRRVNWPTLVERLVEATHGQGPVIQ